MFKKNSQGLSLCDLVTTYNGIDLGKYWLRQSVPAWLLFTLYLVVNNRDYIHKAMTRYIIKFHEV